MSVVICSKICCFSFCLQHSSELKSVVRASQGVFYTEAIAEFLHINFIVTSVHKVKYYAEVFTEATASVASMVTIPLLYNSTTNCTII